MNFSILTNIDLFFSYSIIFLLSSYKDKSIITIHRIFSKVKSTICFISFSGNLFLLAIRKSKQYIGECLMSISIFYDTLYHFITIELQRSVLYKRVNIIFSFPSRSIRREESHALLFIKNKSKIIIGSIPRATYIL